MKIIYTTDLHGDTDKYRQLEEVTSDFEADLVINGGDVLPHGTWGNQSQFITNQLASHFEFFDTAGINYLVQLGNDDMGCLDSFFMHWCESYDRVYNIAQRRISINNFNFIGMNYVLDYPFRLKDRCRLDNVEDTIGVQYGTALQSMCSDDNYEEISNWKQCIRERLTLVEELALLPTRNSFPKNLIYIFHQPPAGISLDVCYDDREVGSQAITNFLTKSNAQFALHGHIHESFAKTGVWKAQLGNTICIQPGQLENFTYVTIDTDIGISERFEI